MSAIPATAAPPAARDITMAAILSGLCLILGVVLALGPLSAPPWMDEFNTYATTMHGHTLRTFAEYVLRGQHPLLFEGPIYIAQQIGVTDIAALRLINLLGVPLVLFAVWISHRRGALSDAQAAVIVALYASSQDFLGYLSALRPYFLVFSASIAAALAWRLMLREGREKALWLWFGALAIFVNLHYFATIFGGLMTLVLLADRVRARDGRGALLVAAISALAASPALILGVLQSGYTVESGTLYYFAPGILVALAAFGAAAFAGIAANVPALLSALGGLRAWRSYAIERALLGVVAVFFALLTIAHLIKPMLFDRYLIAGAGAILVAVAVLSAGAHAHKFAALLICAFALAVQIWVVAFSPRMVGWTQSAEMVAQLSQTCPGTQVYTVPYARLANGAIWNTPLNPTEIEARRYGYRYYAALHHFSIRELAPGATIRASGACPALIWIEHFWPGAGAADLLTNLRLRNDGPATYWQIGSGIVVSVAPNT